MKSLLARTSLCVVSVLSLCAVCAAAPVRLRVDSRVNPLGIDDLKPRFSWQSNSEERNWKQSAYEIQVASSAAKLAAGKADVWDSGKIASGESVSVAYGGPALKSEARYAWRVKVWDAKGVASTSSEASWWEMGLLSPSDWSAKWIHHDDEVEQQALAKMSWIWLANTDAKHVPEKTVAEFRYELPLTEKPMEASLHVLDGQTFTATVNGVKTGHKADWLTFDFEDIRDALKVGSNEIVIRVELPAGKKANETLMASLAAGLRLRTAKGVQWMVTGEGWQGRLAAQGSWAPVQQLGSVSSMKMQRGNSQINDSNKQIVRAPERIVSGSTLYRKEFASKGKPVSAKLYVTAMGTYVAYLNGHKVGNDVLTPGFTDFRKRVQYQTYDVTSMVMPGKNTVAAMLGAGWHGSPLLWIGAHTFRGPDSLCAQLVLTYADGSKETVATDASWMSSESPIVMSEIYGGEAYDARLVQAGWNRNGFAAAGWEPAVEHGIDSGVIVSAEPDRPVHFQQAIRPVSVKDLTTDGQKVQVFDMGQNMVGVVKLLVQGPRGTTVRLRFAERLNPDGTIYTENLRDADATDHYTLSGKGVEIWEPAFTFHGFRYVEVAGYPHGATKASIEGEVWNSLVGGPTMTLTTSSTLLNKMDELGLWGQRGNFVSVPTDCPQRDERMGWMGDAGAFWRTGSYNFDIDAFSDKFMTDVVDAQAADGAFSNISPNLLMSDSVDPHDGHPGAPGWGDAGVLVPYATWLQYGDKALLEKNWAAMEKWMDFIETTNPNHLRQKELGANYADWLAPDPHTPKDLIGTAYWAYISQEMATMAKALGREDDAKKYETTYKKIRAAFQHEYIAQDGVIRGDTQTDYAVAIALGLAPENMMQGMADRLVKNVHAHNDHLTTGFLGTPFLMPALEKTGHDDVAYSLLMSDTYPSWGYMVAKGATTWWERWNGDTGDPSMNSYNHYAFGSVMAWVYRKTAGIDADPADAGYHHVVIEPKMTDKLTHVKAGYESVYGPIKTEWSKVDGGALRLMVTVPANATASVRIPASAMSKVAMDGRAIAGFHDGAVWQDVGSGTYSFTVTP